jgi:CP family cyanate transporter-like MFS transporter
LKNVKLVLLIFIACLNLRMSIQSIPPVINLIQVDLHLNNIQSSLLTSIPVMCMGVFAFFVNWFKKNYGFNKSILILLVLLGVFTFVRGLVPMYVLMLISTLGIGFCIAIIGPLISGFIKKEFPKNTGLLIGIYSLSMGIGAVIASSSVLSLTKLVNGWTIAIAIWGIIPIFAALIWGSLLKRNSSKNEDNVDAVKLPLKNINAWLLVIFFMLQSGLFYGVATWLVNFLKTINWNDQSSIVGLTTFTAIQMIFSFIIPTLLDRYFNINIWILLCDIILIIGGILILFTNVSILIFIGIIFIAIATGGLFPIAMMLPIKMTATPSATSSWTSLVQGFGYMFAGIVPIFMGSMNDIFSSDLLFPLEIIMISIILLLVSLIIVKQGNRRNG